MKTLSKDKAQRIEEVENQLSFNLFELSEDYRNQTQQQYSEGVLERKIKDKLLDLAAELDALKGTAHGSMLRCVNTIWYSSRMADKALVSLSLLLLAKSIDRVQAARQIAADEKYIAALQQALQDANVNPFSASFREKYQII